MFGPLASQHFYAPDVKWGQGALPCAVPASSQSAKRRRKDHTECESCVIEYELPVQQLAVCVLCPGSCSSSAHCVVQDNTAAVVQEAENILRTFFVHLKATVHTRITRNSIGSKAEQRWKPCLPAFPFPPSPPPLSIAHTSLIILVIVICIPTKQWCSLCSSNPNTHPKPTEPAKICFPTTQERLAGWQLSSTMRLAATAAIAAMSMKEKNGKSGGRGKTGESDHFLHCAWDPLITYLDWRKRK